MINSMGMFPFFWYGVVEDRNDPLKLGRVRVRILGKHSKELKENIKTGEGVPVTSLPWAHPAMPITSASMNGIGETPVGPVEGTWVIGISRDGDACQNLVYMFTLPGIPQTEPAMEGFNDTEETIKAADRPHPLGESGSKYPKKSHLKEADTNRLARNEKIDQTIVKKKRDSEDKNVHVAHGGSWNEPTTPYQATYPFNRVFESESGHIHEIDDTPGAERLHEYHRSGTFNEVHPDGTKVEKIVKDNYEIILGNDNIHVKGNCNISIDGDAKVYVKNNADIEVGGNLTETVAGNYSLTAEGVVTIIGRQKIDLNP